MNFITCYASNQGLVLINPDSIVAIKKQSDTELLIRYGDEPVLSVKGKKNTFSDTAIYMIKGSSNVDLTALQEMEPED